MHEINGDLDPGIAPVVHLLRGTGFNTFASCEGGAGHAFAAPTVRIYPDNPTDMRPEIHSLAHVLSEAGYGGYYLKMVHSFQMSQDVWLPQEMSFIELEFWQWQSGDGPVAWLQPGEAMRPLR